MFNIVFVITTNAKYSKETILTPLNMKCKMREDIM